MPHEKLRKTEHDRFVFAQDTTGNTYILLKFLFTPK